MGISICEVRPRPRGLREVESPATLWGLTASINRTQPGVEAVCHRISISSEEVSGKQGKERGEGEEPKGSGSF